MNKFKKEKEKKTDKLHHSKHEHQRSKDKII